MVKRTKSKKGLFSVIISLFIVGSIIGVIYVLNPFSIDDIKRGLGADDAEEKRPEPTVKTVDLNSTSRPFAVVINNLGVARTNHSGLQDAFIIYEFIVEGGLTRYLALFENRAETKRIGSIRSARHYFLDYVLEHDAVLVHNGQSPQAQSDFRSLSIDRIEAEAPKTGFRDKSLGVSSEHTLFSSIELIKNGMSNKRAEKSREFLLNYSVETLDLSNMPNAQVAENVEIVYSGSMKSSYVYDSETGVYNRFVNGASHKDASTSNQYTFTNIITYQVQNSTIAGDTSGRQTLNNVGSGTGYYITKGYAIPITWEKSSRNAQTIYKLEDGTEISVNDGNTFIQIQPSGQRLSIS